MRHWASHAAAARPHRRWVTVPRAVLTLATSSLLVAVIPGAASAGSVTSAASAIRGSGVTRYVSLGDSYTAGPLIPDLTGSPAGCARSTHNYGHLVAAAVRAASFTDVSCQGADTTSMTKPESVPLGTNPPQDNALSSSTTLVTLQIGGNDINAQDVFLECAKLSFTDPFGAPCKAHYTSGGTDQLKAAIAAAAPKVAADLSGIHAHAPNARVLVVGYPVIMPNSGTGCWPVVPIASGDVPYLRGVEQELNAMLASEAAANGATYVNTYTASIGHDVCQAPGVKWVEGLVPTSPAAPFHPNALGEQGMAAQLLKTLG